MALLTGCGAGDVEDGNPDDNTGDANQCSVGIGFDPGTIVAGPTSTVRANGEILGAEGFVDFVWSVRYGADDLVTSAASADGRDVFFTAEQPGIYQVEFDVPGCGFSSAQFNATAPGAADVVYRLRVQPPLGSGLPASERLVVVQGGADASVGTIALAEGVLASGGLTLGGAPAAGYLRLGPLASPGLSLEAFAIADGSFSTRVVAEPHRLLVIPASDAFAPRAFAAWQPLLPDLELDAGQAVSVVVLDPDGQPLVGARVAVTVDGVPSTSAITAGDGRATVRARFDGPTIVTVAVAPDASDPWPRLEATVSGADLDQPIEVAYAAGLVPRSLGGVVITRDGSAVASGAVALVGTHPAAGTITIGAADATATGHTLRTGTTSALGEVQVATPVAGTFALAVRDAQGSAVTSLDSSAAAPSGVTIAGPRLLTMTVVGPDGQPVPGARGVVVAGGALAALAPITRVALADADGMLAWPDAPGGIWDVVVDDPGAQLGRIELAAQLGPILGQRALPAAVRLEGSVTRAIGGTAINGAVVTLLCSDCIGIAAQRPIAVAVTSTVGGFRLAVADPGVAGR